MSNSFFSLPESMAWKKGRKKPNWNGFGIKNRNSGLIARAKTFSRDAFRSDRGENEVLFFVHDGSTQKVFTPDNPFYVSEI